MGTRAPLTFALAPLLAATIALTWPSAAAAADGRAAPSAPQGLRITGATYDSIRLSWDQSAGPVAYYQILRNGTWANSSYGTTGGLNYLTPGTSYSVEVRARDSQGNTSPPATVTATTVADTGPPTTPANLRLVTGAAGQPVGLTWDASTDDRGVGVYRLFANGEDVFGGGQSVSFDFLTDVFCTVFRGETYAFTVRAVDLSGKLSAPGGTVTVTVP
jgi:chitinase